MATIKATATATIIDINPPTVIVAIIPVNAATSTPTKNANTIATIATIKPKQQQFLNYFSVELHKCHP
jgi:hypothetical protein